MKYKIILFTGLGFFLFLGGIIRHDVAEEKYLLLAQETQFDCVGQIFIDTSAIGTCILIDNKYVLTAAHCLTICDVKKDILMKGGQKITYYLPYNYRTADVTNLVFKFNGVEVKAKSITMHPIYDDSSKMGGYYDAAIIELLAPVESIKPIKLCKTFDELNSRYVGVGYGGFCKANEPENIVQDSRKIAGENLIDKYCGVKYNENLNWFASDFDHPTNKKLSKMGKKEPLPLEYITTGGDSGGGAFRLKNGEWELIGFSPIGGVKIKQLLKNGYYGQVNNWHRVSVFAPWIESCMK